MSGDEAAVSPPAGAGRRPEAAGLEELGPSRSSAPWLEVSSPSRIQAAGLSPGRGPALAPAPTALRPLGTQGPLRSLQPRQ